MMKVMKKIQDVKTNIKTKVQKHSFFIFLILSFINILIFIYLLVLVTHPTPEIINTIFSVTTLGITGIGFYLVFINLKSIDEANRINKSTVVYDYYLKRIDSLSQEVETYNFSKYILFEELKNEPIKGLLRFEPIIKIYFSTLSEDSKYVQDSNHLTEIYYSEEIKQRPYKVYIDDLKRLKDDLLDISHKGYYLIIQVNSRKDIPDEIKELLFSEIIREIMAGYIDIAYNFSPENNIIFPNRASKMQPSYYFNAVFYDMLFALVSSDQLQNLMNKNLQLIIETQRIDFIRKTLKERKMFRTRWSFLPE